MSVLPARQVDTRGAPQGALQTRRDLALVMMSPMGDMASMLISCPALSRRHALGWGRNLGSKTDLVVRDSRYQLSFFFFKSVLFPSFAGPWRGAGGIRQVKKISKAHDREKIQHS